MSLEVLMATIDLSKEEDFSKGMIELRRNGIKCLVINQVKQDELNFELNMEKFKLHSYQERGLSKSRNIGLTKAKEDIGLITDQDIRFKKDFNEIILKSFEKNPDADIITFQIENELGKTYKKYKKESYWLNMRDIMKVSSVEIAFRIKSVQDSKLRFDEHFGLGAPYATGEEAIFLSDAIKAGLNILFVPKPIVIHPQNSSGYQFKNNPDLIRAKGAMMFRIYGRLSYILSIPFSLKKHHLYKGSFISFLNEMYKGIKSYRTIINE